MDVKRILAMAGIVVAILVVIHLATRDGGEKKTGYIIDDQGGISYNEVRESLKKVNFDEDKPDSLFSKGVVNPYTLKFFNYLIKRFSDIKDFDKHYLAVQEYLYSVMPMEKADQLLALYKKYIEYQRNLSSRLNSWGMPRNAEEAIDRLHKLQDYRRQIFGKETADALFGAEIKAREYPIRRSAIVYDKDIYGSEKEEMIKNLNQEMWGETDVEEYANPYNRYKEKLEIYNKDLSEMSGAERDQRIKEYRKQYFTPDQVARLEDVDKVIAEEKETESEYRSDEVRIMNDPNLTPEKKTEKVEKLQEKYFGKEGAEAFRRRETIDKELEKMKEKFGG